MAAVNESIEISASPAEVWAVVMDPHRLGDWVTAHRKIYDAPNGELSEGDSFKQKLRVGASFKVKWTIVEASEPTLAVWEGKGPGGSAADVRYELSETDDGGTRFDYCNNFELPGGALSLPAKSVAGPRATKQAKATLKNLKELLES